MKTNPKQIKVWMNNRKEEFRDPKTGEINLTELVESWDAECSTGDATLDPDHIAWEIALEVACKP